MRHKIFFQPFSTGLSRLYTYYLSLLNYQCTHPSIIVRPHDQGASKIYNFYNTYTARIENGCVGQNNSLVSTIWRLYLFSSKVFDCTFYWTIPKEVSVLHSLKKVEPFDL